MRVVPLDLRKALAALCGDDDWGQTWARVIQHRFASEGELHDHAVGNLLIVALWEQLGDHVQALDLVGRLLGAHGRVLPMSAVPLELQALVRGHDPLRADEVVTVRGQATVALTRGEVQSVHLVPHDPPAVPEDVGREHKGEASTQQAFGRFFVDLVREAPGVADRVVTVSPDVGTSTNLGLLYYSL